MISLLIKRLLELVPILAGVSFLTFILFHVAGGDPAFRIAGMHASTEQVEQLRAELGTDQPLRLQYLNFLKEIITFDFGNSWETQTSVAQLLLNSVGPSLCLTVPAYLLSVLLALIFSLILTLPKSKKFDSLFLLLSYSVMSVSLLIVIMALQYVLAYKWNLFPIQGWDYGWLARWQYLSLPILIYSLVLTPPNFLIFRTLVLKEKKQDYTRTAKTKGLSYLLVSKNHILKNLLLPIITLVSFQLPFLFTGTLLLESFFSIPGVGGALYGAITNADFPLIKAITIFGTLIYIFFNFVGDFFVTYLDPRIGSQ